MAVILHLAEFTKGGIETHLNEVLSYQADKHEVHLMASELNSNRDTLQIAPERLILYPYKRSPLQMVKAMLAMRQAIKRIKPDIVHVHGTFAGFFVRTLLLLQPKRPPLIYCSHGWSFLMDTAPWKQTVFAGIERLLAARTDWIIHISGYEYKMAMARGLPERKSSIVYNGVSDKTREHLPFTVNPGKINLLYVGRFDRQKGFDLLLETFNRSGYDNIDLYLVGDTVLGAADYAYPDNAIRLGWVANTEIDRYMQSCDAVIVPSRWEGFGIVAIEALRNSKPVIASSRGALPEIVRHGINGYLFDFVRPEQLEEILRSLDKQTLARMGEAGKRIFTEKFRSELMNEQIEQLYDKVGQGRSGHYSAAVNKYV
jgi:glycosyltransferase involved in cell wall biosynthesis